MMEYAYYPGCSLHSTAKEYDESTRAVCRKLGIELVEIPDWNCCGATSAHAVNRELSLALPLRNLAKAEAMGLDVMAPCAACFNRLKSADAAAKDHPDALKSVAEKSGIDYQGKIGVLSLLNALDSIGAEEIKSHVKRELAGLKPACYYGCLLLRPADMIRFDDPEHPTSMDNIVAALGAEPVDWPHKTECCGASFSISKSDIVVKLTHDILSAAKKAGANCIVTACPLCQGNLDMRQEQVEAAYGEKYGMPVFYITQVMGMAFGIPSSELGLTRLMVSPDRVLVGVGK